MTRTIALGGLFPRSESYVKATWNADKGLVTPAQFEAQRLEEVRRILAVQERLHVEAATDGNLTWQDQFRGLIENHPSFEVGGVTRLFETNRFYRQPIVRAPPEFRPDALLPHFLLQRLGPKAPKKAILPGPYWFARAARHDYTQDSKEGGRDLAAYLNDVARWLEGLGYQQIQFNEPLLFYERQPDTAWAHDLIAQAARGLRATTILNFPNGNAAPHEAWAHGLPVNALGVDFVETHVEELSPLPKEKGLLAAVVDAQESLHETAQDVETLVAAVERRLKPTRLTLTHTWDLESLPAPVAEKKLETLAQAAHRTVVA